MLHIKPLQMWGVSSYILEHHIWSDSVINTILNNNNNTDFEINTIA